MACQLYLDIPLSYITLNTRLQKVGELARHIKKPKSTPMGAPRR
jgi:hypothetical protein